MGIAVRVLGCKAHHVGLIAMCLRVHSMHVRLYCRVYVWSAQHGVHSLDTHMHMTLMLCLCMLENQHDATFPQAIAGSLVRTFDWQADLQTALVWHEMPAG